MRVLGWLASWLFLAGLGSSLPGRIHFGGIFDADDWESELIFRTAVDRLNEDESLLRNSRVVVNLDRLQTDNSYYANRIVCSLLQNGLTAVFGPRSERSALHVQSVCDNLEVPHVNSRWDHRLVRDTLHVNLYPHPYWLSRAFFEILTIWNWKAFTLVYEQDEAIVRMKDFITEGEKRKLKIELRKIPSPNAKTYREVFWQIKKSDTLKGKEALEHHIVLDVPTEHLYSVLKAAQQVGMMTEHQKYLITNLDLHTIRMDDFQYSKANITGLRLVQEDRGEFHSVLRDMNYKLSRRNRTTLDTLKTETALIFDGVRLLGHALERMDEAKQVPVFPPISCNLMNKGVDGTSLVNIMKNVKMKSPGLTGIIEFDPEGFRSSMALDMMQLTTLGLIKIGQIVVNPKEHERISVNITTQGIPDYQFLGLKKMHFKVSTLINKPYTMLRESSQTQTGNDRFEGFAIDVMKELANKLDFTYTLHEVADKKHGAWNKTTEKWNGMIAEVISGVADLAICDLTITSERIRGVDFTLPFMQTGISILFKKPTEKASSLFSFLLPFSGEVWLLIVIAYIYISLLLFLVGRMSPYEWMNPYPCRAVDQVEANCFSLLNSMWWAIGSLLQQGSDVSPTASSTRALTGTWSFFKLIMISSYTANLAAFLTIEKLVSPIESAEDLVKQDKIKYGCLKSGSTKIFFQKSNLSTYQKMYKFMEKHADEVYVGSNDEGIEKVKKGNYAFMMEATSIEYNIQRECNLTQIGGLLDSKGYGIAIKKGNSKIRNWLSGGILELQEGGVLYTLKERWWKEKKGGGRCEAGKASSTANELGLKSVGGVLLVMALGLVLAACVAVVEFFWFHRKLQRDPKKSLCKKFLHEVRGAITCGSSTKPAPKFKRKSDEENRKKEKSGYAPFK